MKIYAILTLGRQIDGEYCLLKVDKAFQDPKRADEYHKSIINIWKENIDTPLGSIECMCERGLFEIEVE